MSVKQKGRAGRCHEKINSRTFTIPGTEEAAFNEAEPRATKCDLSQDSRRFIIHTHSQRGGFYDCV